jgi:hypothetical protein
MNNLFEKLKEIPNIIENTKILKKPNSPIRIFKGNFLLINSEHDIKIDVMGEINFEWFPNYGCIFLGNISIVDFEKFILMPYISYNVIINKIDLGKAFIHKTRTSTSSNKTLIQGVFENKVLVGIKKELIDEIIFSIPNLKSISGEVVKKISSTQTRTTRSRISLVNHKWKIIIDKNIEYDNLKEELEIVGGYNILYTGKITSIEDNKFTYHETEEIIECLDLFLSFINGRKIATLFLNGFNEGTKKWIDYSPKSVEAYKDVTSCIYYRNINSLDKMWKEFSAIWESEKGKDFLKSIIHWYTQSNNKAGLLEGAIIMAQAGLEKLYYWTAKAENHPENTPQKLRKLTKYLQIKDFEVLSNYTNLNEFSQIYIEKDNHRDVAGIITTIRNNIIHPIETVKINSQTKSEALQLSLWVIEIALLKICKYEGKYQNRTTGKTIEFEHNNMKKSL